MDISEGIFTNFLSGIIWSAFILVAAVAWGFISWKLPIFARSIFVRAIAFSLLLAAITISSYIFIISAEVSMVLVAFVAAALSLRFAHRLHCMGFVYFSDNTSSAVDADASLRLARDRIDFLGIGAHKLTKSDEFEEALVRCASGNVQARFLISPEKICGLRRLRRGTVT